MIWRNVPADELSRAAMAIAARLGDAPPHICREIHHAFHAVQTRDLASKINYERLRQRELLDAPSLREGIQAFQQKRAPRFHPK